VAKKNVLPKLALSWNFQLYSICQSYADHLLIWLWSFGRSHRCTGETWNFYSILFRYSRIYG